MKVRANFETKPTCRSCGRTLRESAFSLGMKCLDYAQKDEARKQRAIAQKLACADRGQRP
jgi:hypothetical protein